MRYNWQLSDWPRFQFQTAEIEPLLRAYLQNSGKLEGAIRTLGELEREETIIELLIAESIKTSEIEGEFLSRADVASSIRRNLGLHDGVEGADQRARGIAEVMVSARYSFADPLTERMLLSWHAALLSHEPRMDAGRWRSHAEPMQIVSGAIGFERVHFVAPLSSVVRAEMKRFLQWFNATAPGGADLSEVAVHAPIRAAVAHLYFESIHPFEDGNGRMGRVLAEKALAQTTGFPNLTSLSITIERNKKEYYAQLERAQRSLEITPWVQYFVGEIVEGQRFAQDIVDFTLRKSRYFDRFRTEFNPAQRKVIDQMFDAGPSGFQGGMTASKYSRLARVSKATATRHLVDLAQKGALVIEGQGKTTRYQIADLDP